MSKTIQLYASGSDFANATGTVGLLCEFAPDSPSLRRAESCYGPEELLGSRDEALVAVYPLVSKLLKSTPIIDDLPLLYIFEESLLEQLSYIVQAFHLDRWIAEHGFDTCHFISYSSWLDRLLQVRAITGSTYALVTDVPLLETNRSARALRKLWDSRPAPPEFMRRVMPLWSRNLAAYRRRKQAENAPRGGIWFYSTAYNYSKIGLQYEPYLPQKMHFLVEEPATGGKRLREVGREAHWLYAWARTSDIPSASEVRSAGDRITGALRQAPLDEEQDRLRSVLLNSEWWHHFLARRLSFAIFNNRALGRWHQAVAPEMLVVGNAGWERAVLLRQNVERVPTVLLQHGIMHWTYAVTDEPVDVFLLRGPFFQRSVSQSLRRKTVLHNFPEAATTSSRPAGDKGRDILFITTPYDVPVLFHPADLEDIQRSLLRVAHASGRRLVIRVHPLEKVSGYRHAIAELQKELGFSVDVEYSQGPGADGIFARASVAVLHFSTMFLDCLRHAVPIVSFGWHWFPNRGQYEQEGIFHLAKDLTEFEGLVRQGLEGNLPVRRAGLEEFLAPSRPEEMKSLFQQIWEERRAASSGVLHPAGS
jgi:hypothetical protein